MRTTINVVWSVLGILGLCALGASAYMRGSGDKEWPSIFWALGLAFLVAAGSTRSFLKAHSQWFGTILTFASVFSFLRAAYQYGYALAVSPGEQPVVAYTLAAGAILTAVGAVAIFRPPAQRTEYL